jgi:hypothetical protein
VEILWYNADRGGGLLGQNVAGLSMSAQSWRRFSLSPLLDEHNSANARVLHKD